MARTTPTTTAPEPAETPAETNAVDAAFAEISSDCYITPTELVLDHHALWPEGIGADPFHDPESQIGATRTLDIRKGQDAYRDDWWDDEADDVQTSLANGPYSGSNPEKTAETIAFQLVRFPHAEVTNLCPAAPGSEYWKRYVWPNAIAIAWLGRYAFVAGRTMYDKKDPTRIVAEKGQRLFGNRTEIALVYTVGDEVKRPKRRAQRFREVFRHFPVITL